MKDIRTYTTKTGKPVTVKETTLNEQKNLLTQFRTLNQELNSTYDPSLGTYDAAFRRNLEMLKREGGGQ